MDRIEQAFKAIKRENFLPRDRRGQSFIDSPLPIGFGQTNSQPSTVRMMLRWLEPEPGNKVLDIGSGSGWTTALLGNIVGPKGKVYAVEIIPELVEFGRENVKKAGIGNVEFHQAGPELGLPKHGPYDRILVSAAAQTFPKELLDQLKEGGKMVIPVQNDILEVEKGNQGIKITKHPGFVFVPLI